MLARIDIRVAYLMVMAVVLVACGGGGAAPTAAPVEDTGPVGLATVANPDRGRPTLPPAASPTKTDTPDPSTPTLTRTPITTPLPTRDAVATSSVSRPSLPATAAVADSDPTVGGGSGIIAFQSSRAGQFALFTIDTNGDNLRQLTDPTQFSGRPNFSPDGNSIAFVARRTLDEDVFVLDLATLQEQRLTNYTGADRAPVFGPDGIRIAYESDQDSVGFDIFIYFGADGIQNITQSVGTNGFPVWSPDGSRIAFTSNRTGVATIHFMNPDGSAVADTQLQGFVTGWSPDGQYVIYHSDRDSVGFFDLYLLRADMQGEQNLTNTPDISESFGAFSPDGTYLAYHGNATGNDDIYIRETFGGATVNITDNPAEDRYPAWQP